MGRALVARILHSCLGGPSIKRQGTHELGVPLSAACCQFLAHAHTSSSVYGEAQSDVQTFIENVSVALDTPKPQSTLGGSDWKLLQWSKRELMSRGDQERTAALWSRLRELESQLVAYSRVVPVLCRLASELRGEGLRTSGEEGAADPLSDAASVLDCKSVFQDPLYWDHLVALVARSPAVQMDLERVHYLIAERVLPHIRHRQELMQKLEQSLQPAPENWRDQMSQFILGQLGWNQGKDLNLVRAVLGRPRQVAPSGPDFWSAVEACAREVGEGTMAASDFCQLAGGSPFHTKLRQIRQAGALSGDVELLLTLGKSELEAWSPAVREEMTQLLRWMNQRGGEVLQSVMGPRGLHMVQSRSLDDKEVNALLWWLYLHPSLVDPLLLRWSELVDSLARQMLQEQEQEQQVIMDMHECFQEELAASLLSSTPLTEKLVNGKIQGLLPPAVSSTTATRLSSAPSSTTLLASSRATSTGTSGVASLTSRLSPPVEEDFRSGCVELDQFLGSAGSLALPPTATGGGPTPSTLPRTYQQVEKLATSSQLPEELSPGVQAMLALMRVTPPGSDGARPDMPEVARGLHDLVEAIRGDPLASSLGQTTSSSAPRELSPYWHRLESPSPSTAQQTGDSRFKKFGPETQVVLSWKDRQAKKDGVSPTVGLHLGLPVDEDGLVQPYEILTSQYHDQAIQTYLEMTFHHEYQVNVESPPESLRTASRAAEMVGSGHQGQGFLDLMRPLLDAHLMGQGMGPLLDVEWDFYRSAALVEFEPYEMMEESKALKEGMSLMSPEEEEEYLWHRLHSVVTASSPIREQASRYLATVLNNPTWTFTDRRHMVDRLGEISQHLEDHPPPTSGSPYSSLFGSAGKKAAPLVPKLRRSVVHKRKQQARDAN